MTLVVVQNGVSVNASPCVRWMKENDGKSQIRHEAEEEEKQQDRPGLTLAY